MDEREPTSVWEATDYRDIVRRRSRASGISFKSLAGATHIHTSYFSRVMTGKAEFSEDQLYLIGKALQLREKELELFLLMGSAHRTGVANHRNFLQKRINQMRSEENKLTDRLKGVFTGLGEDTIGIYYRNPVTAEVHMFLTIDRFRQNPRLIARQLGLSERRLESELIKLEALGLISRDGEDQITMNQRAIHLDESHPVSRENHRNWRHDAIQHLIREEPQPSDYHLSAVFSCDEETKIKIREHLQKSLAHIQELVSQSSANERIFHLGVDLY